MEFTMSQDKLNGGGDLLAQAMRRVFREEVQGHPDDGQDAAVSPEQRLLDDQSGEAVDRI